jgi:NAD+ synthase
MALADHLDVPTDLDVRPAAAVARSDAARLGLSSRDLDAVCRLALDENREPRAVADRLGVETAVVETVREWARETAHKRREPSRPSWQ